MSGWLLIFIGVGGLVATAVTVHLVTLRQLRDEGDSQP